MVESLSEQKTSIAKCMSGSGPYGTWEFTDSPIKESDDVSFLVNRTNIAKIVAIEKKLMTF